MQKYLLASLRVINEKKCFLFPQYEYLEEGIAPIENRRLEFPDRGTIYMPKKENESLDKYANKLVKILFDDSNIATNYDERDIFAQTSKYIAYPSDIVDLSKDEIVEVITIEDMTIEELIRNKQSRTLLLEDMPLNKKILIRIDEFCYGPFNYVQEESETKVKVRIVPDDYQIVKYRMVDLEPYVYEAQVSSDVSDPKRKFIQEVAVLEEKVRLIETIEYLDNDMIIQECLKILMDGRAIDNVGDNAVNVLRDLRTVLELHTDLFEKNPILTMDRLDKLTELVEQVGVLSEYKQKIIEEYFKSGLIGDEDKQIYLQANPEVLQNAISQTNEHKAAIEQMTARLERGELELSQLQERKSKLEEEIQTLEKNEELYKKNALETIRVELEKITVEIDEAKREKDRLEGDIEIAKRTKNNLIRESNDLNIEIEGKITQWLEQKRDNEIIAFLVSEFGKYKKPEEVEEEKITSRQEFLTGQDVIDKIRNYFERANRYVSVEDIVNYLVTITGNFITVFAGQPGTGKTSTCNLLAKAIGVYGKRYAEISVGKGWTSSRDLIGYYNSLTQTFEETQPKFTKCLETLTREAEGGKDDVPYWVLLDEANLSQVEHYWADFNQISDDFEGKTILVSNCKKYQITDELRFLATINYDHTTEVLSPRFLDRAWIIRMEGTDVFDMLSGEVSDESVENATEMISQSDMIRFFSASGKEMQGRQISPYTIDVLTKFIECFMKNGHAISYRSVLAMKRYCIVAEYYMPNKSTALDLAIIQKLLPQINGSGTQYLQFLEKLLEMSKDYQLTKCEKLINRIKEIGTKEHNYFNYFNV